MRVLRGVLVPACFLVPAYPGRPRKGLQNIFLLFCAKKQLINAHYAITPLTILHAKLHHIKSLL